MLLTQINSYVIVKLNNAERFLKVMKKLIISVLLTLSFLITITSFTYCPRTKFNVYNDKYNYFYQKAEGLYRWMEAIFIAEYVGEIDEYYCKFIVTEKIFGEAEIGECVVKIPQKLENVYSTENTETRFIEVERGRNDLVKDLVIGEKYLIYADKISVTKIDGNIMKYYENHFVLPYDFPINEPDIDIKKAVGLADFVKWLKLKSLYYGLK